MYQFAAGYNNEGSLQDVVPQPRSIGIEPGSVETGVDGHAYERGYQHTEWLFSCVTAEQAADLLSDFGLDDARSVECTISSPLNDTEEDDVREFGNFNAIMHKPIIGKQGTYQYWWKNLVFPIERMVAL